jgi:HSP20 family protein
MDKKERNYLPALCDIYREEDTVTLIMEMPGVSKDNLDVKVDGDKLMIHGKKDFDDSKGKYILREIKVCDYHHEFSIDDTIDRNKIEASIKNGIVEISLGIKESEKPRKIKVNVK